MWKVKYLDCREKLNVVMIYVFIYQSGQPYVNPDGSVYRFDPSNPPQMNKSSHSHHKKDTEKKSPLHGIY